MAADQRAARSTTTRSGPPSGPEDPRRRPAGFPRYLYAGAWGYEAGLLTPAGAPTSALPPVRLLHVGARW